MADATAGLAIVPAAGAAAFAAFAWLAMRADLAVQKAEALGRRVMMRPWSIVSDDDREAGHWLLLVASIAYATAVPATALWQYELAPEGTDRTQLVVTACVAAAGFFLMALVPHRDSRSSPAITPSAIFHTVTAGVFLAAGCAHASITVFIASDTVDGAALFAVRAALGSLMFLSVLCMLFGALYLYYKAAHEFNGHYYPASCSPTIQALPEKRDLALRTRMRLLAVLQAVYGAAYAGLISTCAVEVLQLPEGGALTGGVVCGALFAVTSSVAAVAARWCRIKARGGAKCDVLRSWLNRRQSVDNFHSGGLRTHQTQDGLHAQHETYPASITPAPSPVTLNQAIRTP